MSTAPVRPCARCGRSLPVTEMRVIHEEVRSGRSSGRNRSTLSAGGAQSFSAGGGFRTSHSQRATTSHLSGATRYRDTDNYYCEVGCYPARLAQKRLIRSFQIAGYGLLTAGLIMAALFYATGRTPRAAPAGASLDPPAPGEVTPVLKSTPVETVDSDLTANHQPGPIPQSEPPPQTVTQAPKAEEVPLPTPQTVSAIADAVDKALTTGEPQRWNARGENLAGGVSVSSVQSYSDRQCRSYRYTVESRGETKTAPSAVGCALTGGSWSYALQP